MDILAHTLWAAAAAKRSRNLINRKISIWWSAFFGVLPDLFSFSALFLWAGMQYLTGHFTIDNMPRPSDVEPSAPDTIWVFRLTALLYNTSHSMIAFFIVFTIIFLIQKRMPLPLLGWLFHIVIDIGTHSYSFFPTPVFWPLSGWRFDGLAWDTPWFLVVNYTALVLVYALFMREGAWARTRVRMEDLLIRLHIFKNIEERKLVEEESLESRRTR